LTGSETRDRWMITPINAGVINNYTEQELG